MDSDRDDSATGPEAPHLRSAFHDEDAAILAEMERLQNAAPGWGRGLLILIVSLVLFMGAGLTQGSVETLIVLIPVLFFHELGHYVAMRVFGYRNVQMFFIPFFGAAVSGRHYNVAAWKKVLVSLAGPLPGIALGFVLSFVGLASGQKWLVSTALMCLFLNGLQLLPLLPLDGGWVLHQTLFCRHPFLDVAFRVFAVAGMLGLWFVTRDSILLIIAVPMAIGIPGAWQSSRAVQRLRAAGVGRSRPVPAEEPELAEPIFEEDPAVTPAAGEVIPEPVARAIIAEVRQTFTGIKDQSVLARLSLQIFETLNSRPPGVLATLGLLFLHAAGFVVAFVVLAITFVAAQQIQRAEKPRQGFQDLRHHQSCRAGTPFARSS